MKVMKFGGTSVGSVKSILSLKSIVEAEAGRPTSLLPRRKWQRMAIVTIARSLKRW